MNPTFSVKGAYSWLNDGGLRSLFATTICGIKAPLKVRVFLCLIAIRLPSPGIILRKGVGMGQAFVHFVLMMVRLLITFSFDVLQLRPYATIVEKDWDFSSLIYHPWLTRCGRRGANRVCPSLGRSLWDIIAAKVPFEFCGEKERNSRISKNISRSSDHNFHVLYYFGP